MENATFKEKLKALQQEFDEFVYLASHDLKEPSRKIVTFGERLTSSLADKLTGDEKLFFDRMMDAAQRQHVMISDLLTLSRIKTTDFQREKFSLNELLEELKYKNSTKLALKKDEKVLADRTQLKTALQEVIDNAEKFTAEPAEISIVEKPIFSTVIDAKGLNPENSYVYFIIADKGVGIEHGQEANVFKPFFRVFGRGKYEGSGMGLAITKAILEKMGGAVWADPIENYSTAIHFLLPT